MKKVLIITSYYPPEIGAASNRIFQLAKGLKELGFETSVVTPLPNYPTGDIFDDYKGTLIHKSEEDTIRIFRLWLYASNSKNKIHRFLAMISYSLSLVWFFIFNKIPKTVLVQSPPLLVAFTCMLCLKRKHRKLLLNVSDLWPSAGLELGVFKENFGYKLLQRMEAFNYQRADLVLGQSQEILDHVRTTVENKDLFLYRNFPDFQPPEITAQESTGKKIKVVYAGLLGVAQGILKLCKALDYSAIEFHIYGSGPEKEHIVSFIDLHRQLPITYHGQVGREFLHQELVDYDVALVPLLSRIYGSVPSKIFEYARLGLPVIYFGGGEGEALVEKHRLGWVVEIGNYERLNTLLSQLKKADFTTERKRKIQQEALKAFDHSAQILKLKHVL